MKSNFFLFTVLLFTINSCTQGTNVSDEGVVNKKQK